VKKNIELLAPGGDVDSIKAAILAGANAVYCGLDKFNARNRAENITFDALNGILRLAHKHNCEVFLTLNIILVESEIPALLTLLNKLVNTSIDGVIVQDLGLFYLLSKYFKTLKIHASTQLTTHNAGQIQFLSKLLATRVNLSRELNIHEIKNLTSIAHRNNILAEVFVHGSYCISFSGLCYMSSVHGGNSGNRGRCSQPCRDEYVTTAKGKNFPLNMKDNSAYLDLKELADAGVDSIKIEGRIKKFHYVYTVVDAWRQQLERHYSKNKLIEHTNQLYKVFNRDFSNGFLKGDINTAMFIDNPRDNSALHLSEINGKSSAESLEKAKGDIYDERTEIINTVEYKIAHLNAAKAPLIISISGEKGSALKILVKTPDTSFEIVSSTNLITKINDSLNYDMLLKRLKAINDTEYYIEQLDLTKLDPNLFLPFNELTSIKKRVLYILNGSKEYIDPIDVPTLKTQVNSKTKPTLSVLISSEKDLYLCNETSATLYFQLPNSFGIDFHKYLNIFTNNPNLIPWFPSILIGDDFFNAVEFLKQIHPTHIVTNNTGIAYEALKLEIPWIAGPHLNIANSYSLSCLKENFNCKGAFVSNELSRIQLKGIKKPNDFELFFSIYHPITLMTSRQCLFHQVTGCEKNKLDNMCIQQCEKSASISNLKKETSFIEKSKGNYHTVYNQANYLNTDIISDIPDTFSSFFIDLTNIKTETKIEGDKLSIVKLFEDFINGKIDARSALECIEKNIQPTTNKQYKIGI